MTEEYREFNIKVKVVANENADEAFQVIGREIISAMSETTNPNVLDIVVTEIDFTVPEYKVSCLPDEEISELAQ